MAQTSTITTFRAVASKRQLDKAFRSLADLQGKLVTSFTSSLVTEDEGGDNFARDVIDGLRAIQTDLATLKNRQRLFEEGVDLQLKKLDVALKRTGTAIASTSATNSDHTSALDNVEWQSAASAAPGSRKLT